ncbi:MAG: toxin-antitoxin system HicB family antitoxin [Chloroflexia bacterium]
MDKFSINVFWSDEDEGFIAACNEIPTLSAFGETRDEAIAELESVIAATISVYEGKGWELPKVKEQLTYSGQLRVRFPKFVHAALVQEAEREGISLNSLINAFICERLGATHAINRIESTATGLTDKADAVMARLSEAVTAIDQATEQVRQTVGGIVGTESEEIREHVTPNLTQQPI